MISIYDFSDPFIASVVHDKAKNANNNKNNDVEQVGNLQFGLGVFIVAIILKFH